MERGNPLVEKLRENSFIHIYILFVENLISRSLAPEFSNSYKQLFFFQIKKKETKKVCQQTRLKFWISKLEVARGKRNFFIGYTFLLILGMNFPLFGFFFCPIHPLADYYTLTCEFDYPHQWERSIFFVHYYRYKK